MLESLGQYQQPSAPVCAEDRPPGSDRRLADPAVGLTMPPSDATETIVQTLVLALDLFGTFVFALSGAMAGIRHRLDLFGVLVLSFAAATAGGIIRDLVIGAVPPACSLTGATSWFPCSRAWRRSGGIP